MGLIDILVIATFVISIGCALYRGLAKELLSISAWIFAAFAALYGFTFLRPFWALFFKNPVIVDLCSAGSIALVVLIILTLINAHITGHLRKSALSGLDRTLGFLFGIFRAVLLISVVYLIAQIPFSAAQMKKATAENYSMPYIAASAQALENILPESLKAGIDTNSVAQTAKKIHSTAQKMKEEAAEYTDEERESLDDLIENSIDIKELMQ